MKLENTSRTTLTHDSIVFKPGDISDIPDNVAKIWLKINGIKQFIDPVKVKEEEARAAALLAKANAKIAELENEVKELKEKLTKKTTKKATKK